MIIDDNESDADVELPSTGDVAGTAYRETLTSADGFTRGPNGRVKFNKDTKKRRREDDAMDVDVDVDEMSPGKSKRTKKKDEFKLGHEFKAKVSDDFDLWIKSSPYPYRKLRVISRKAGSSLTPTCRLLKLQRQDGEDITSGLQARDEMRYTVSLCIFYDSIQYIYNYW